MIVGLSLQTYFSIQHVQGAAHFARQAAISEASLEQKSEIDSVRIEAIASATSSIFLSVAFLEALANELFADSKKPNGGHLKGICDKGLALIAELAEDDAVEKSSVLTKFNLLLKAVGETPMSKGEFPTQDVATVIRLRNNLVHYKASWLDVGTEGMVRSGNLRGSSLYKSIFGKFSNRAGSTEASGDAWLGAGCAKWGVESSIAYTDLVFEKLRVIPIYNHVRSRLSV